MRKTDAQHAVASRSHRLTQGAQRVEVIIDDPETLAAFGRAIEAAGNKSDAVRLALRLAFPSVDRPRDADAKSLSGARAALAALDPHSDASVAVRKLSHWERTSLMMHAQAHPEVMTAVRKYQSAGVRLTAALYHAAAHYAAIVQDAQA